MNNNELKHYGVLGMKWGVRRYTNSDGSLSEAGKKRYASNVADMAMKRGGMKTVSKLKKDQFIKNESKKLRGEYNKLVELDEKISKTIKQLEDDPEIERQVRQTMVKKYGAQMKKDGYDVDYYRKHGSDADMDKYDEGWDETHYYEKSSVIDSHPEVKKLTAARTEAGRKYMDSMKNSVKNIVGENGNDKFWVKKLYGNHSEGTVNAQYLIKRAIQETHKR